jgi:hypothetical protein
MKLIQGKTLRFRCRTTSPFNTSRQEYANLIKCAPFILGSTIRGALLRYLIETHCPAERIAHLATLRESAAISTYHRDCKRDCVVKPFFVSQSLISFSFGHFAGDEKIYGALTRIAIERRYGSVAEGAIVNVEVIKPGVEFDFEITLLGKTMVLTNEVKSAIEAVGTLYGLGRLRSIGLGRFAVERVEALPWADVVEKRIGEWMRIDMAPRLTVEFVTPYVLSAGEGPPPSFTREALARRVRDEIQDAVSTVTGEPADELPLSGVDMTLKPEYISRFSYERGVRENRLVAWTGSSLTLHFDSQPLELQEYLAIASLIGLGEWREWGYGRFRARL